MTASRSQDPRNHTVYIFHVCLLSFSIKYFDIPPTLYGEDDLWIVAGFLLLMTNTPLWIYHNLPIHLLMDIWIMFLFLTIIYIKMNILYRCCGQMVSFLSDKYLGVELLVHRCMFNFLKKLPKNSPNYLYHVIFTWQFENSTCSMSLTTRVPPVLFNLTL